MDFKLICFILILSISICSGYHRHKNFVYEDSSDDSYGFYDSYNNDSDDDDDPTPPEEDDEPPGSNESNGNEAIKEPNDSNANSAFSDAPRYEVTEEVDDIPNNMQFRPIATNFTITRPINLANPNNTVSRPVNFVAPYNVRNVSTKFSNAVKSKDNIGKAPVNVISVVNKSGPKHTHQDIFNFNNVLKDSINSFKKGLGTGFKNVEKDLVGPPNSYIGNINANDIVKILLKLFNHSHDDDEFDDI